MQRHYRLWLSACSLVLLVSMGHLGSSPSPRTNTAHTAPPVTDLAPDASALSQQAAAPAVVIPTGAADVRPGDVLDATSTRTPTPINIGNFVWDDLDKDGRQDANEPGVGGVTVQLWNSTKTALLDSATTNASGLYTVTAPLPGDYRVRVLLPGASDSFSPKDQAGGDNQLDSDINPDGTNFGFTDVFNLASNVISTTVYDAGIIVFRTPTPTRTPTPINIGNFVWHDLNANGNQDAGEPGVGGVTVQLWNSTKTALLDSATTNASGLYSVTAPLPGNYRVRVLPPTVGTSFAPIDSGATDLLDSDINPNPNSSDFGFTNVFSIASNVISITTFDAGLVNLQPSPTPTRTSTPTVTRTPGPTSTGTSNLPRRGYVPYVER